MKNTIYRDSEGMVNITDAGKVILRLYFETHLRTLGVIKATKAGVTYSKTEKEQNTFRKKNAWGINDRVLNYLPAGSLVKITTEKGSYTASKETILQNGQYFHFTRGGYELQIFVPKEYFKFKPKNHANKGKNQNSQSQTPAH